MESPEKYIPLDPSEIEPSDLTTTVWRLCLKNGWSFVPNFAGGEPWIDTRCAWALVSPKIAYKTALNGILAGVQRHPGNTVLLSDVMTRRKEL